MLMKNRIVKFVVLVCCLCSMPGVVRAQLSVHQFDQLMKKLMMSCGTRKWVISPM